MFPAAGRRYIVLLGLSTAWLLLIALPSLVPETVWNPLIRIFFSPTCHQLPERSFVLNGQTLAVCHRCTGLYFGFWLGVLGFPWMPRFRYFLATRPRWVLLFWVPLIINVLVANSPVDRFGTGVLAGFPISVLAWVALEQLGTRADFRYRRLS